MQEMQVQATVPGGQQMQVNVNGQMLAVTVPPGVQPGMMFSFQVAAPQPVQAQPVMAQPVMAQPVQPAMQPMMAQPAVVIQQAQPEVVHVHHGPGMYGVGGSSVPPGAPPGGSWMMESYCGDQTVIATLIVAFFFLPAACCVPCCKCDQRHIYVAPGGTRYMPHGGIAPTDECCTC